jgi:hypothetical protein
VTNASDVTVEVFADDAAVTPIGIAVIIRVAAITGAIIAITGANADAHADRARANPHALRARRHGKGNARRGQKSNSKFPHGNLLFATLG